MGCDKYTAASPSVSMKYTLFLYTVTQEPEQGIMGVGGLHLAAHFLRLRLGKPSFFFFFSLSLNNKPPVSSAHIHGGIIVGAVGCVFLVSLSVSGRQYRSQSGLDYLWRLRSFRGDCFWIVLHTVTPTSHLEQMFLRVR